MSTMAIQKKMLETVAQALGRDLLKQVTFVGGCTTGLLLTDEFAKERVRNTNDVDLIFHVMGYVRYLDLQNQLRNRGFSVGEPDPSENMPICAMKIGNLRVDFMPDDPSILGFTNRWYKDAIKSASSYNLKENLNIRLVSPVYFLATKIEAYKGRGGNDPLTSRDIEDLLSLVDGREEIIEEIRASEDVVREYISSELGKLMSSDGFEWAISSQANGSEQEKALYGKLEKIINLNGS
jgi:predicted nucleotidyltransferase